MELQIFLICISLIIPWIFVFVKNQAQFGFRGDGTAPSFDEQMQHCWRLKAAVGVYFKIPVQATYAAIEAALNREIGIVL